MPELAANGLQIEYDEFGDADAPAMLLIMGLGTQMIAWPEPFCERLAAEGFRVLRFDNRDIGLSTKMEGAKSPGTLRLMLSAWLGIKPPAPYSLDDMAADAVGVLDALDVPAAHIVGASMGGMIAQIVAAEYPQRTLSLVSIMSTSGRRGLPGAEAEVTKKIFGPRPKLETREEIVDYLSGNLRAISSPAYPVDEERLRELVERSVERSYYPAGFMRQLAAIIADGSRVERLKKIEAPTLVIHGKADPLVPVECGIDTAEHIPGAKLELIEGMGHDLPQALWDRMAGLIAEHAREATPAGFLG